MSNSNNNKPSLKDIESGNPSRWEVIYDVDVDGDIPANTPAATIVGGVAEAAAGGKNNNDITTCRVCASNGWPHEPIDFGKVNGKIRGYGTYEAAYWKLKDYYAGEPHEHKPKERKQEQEQDQQSSGRYYMGFDLEAMQK